MGLLDWLFGRKDEPRMPPAAPTYDGPGDGVRQPSEADEQALQRYRYMLRTAPPEAIEQAHEDAFAKLTPAQRAEALRELAAVTPEEERAALTGGRDDPRSLARLVTRAEMRQPGTMERTFGGRGLGTGMGGMMAGTLFSSLVGGVVGSMIAEQFFDSVGDIGFDESNPSEQLGDEQTDDSAAEDFGDTGGDFGGDVGGDFGGGF